MKNKETTLDRIIDSEAVLKHSNVKWLKFEIDEPYYADGKFRDLRIKFADLNDKLKKGEKILFCRVNDSNDIYWYCFPETNYPIIKDLIKEYKLISFYMNDLTQEEQKNFTMHIH